MRVGGAVETYWKSLAMPYSAPTQLPTQRMPRPFRHPGSAQTSPSNQLVSGNGGQTITLSSLTGDYVYFTVQVTRDLNPVLYNKWKVPLANLDLSIFDVTFAQLKSSAVGMANGDTALRSNAPAASTQDWHNALSGSLMSLHELLEVSGASTMCWMTLSGEQQKLSRVVSCRSFLRTSASSWTSLSPHLPRGRGIPSITVDLAMSTASLMLCSGQCILRHPVDRGEGLCLDLSIQTCAPRSIGSSQTVSSFLVKAWTKSVY